ncbi:transposase [Xanthobacter autotrophicus]|uniref:transposase n=1 Tax=Xanthobacter autotrophicus TaxID=280 RepID=UPI003729FBD3
MDVYTDTPISWLEIVESGGRRRFSDEAKLRIVEESYSGRRLGSATARKYGITRTQLTSDAARAGRFGPASRAGFVPAVIVPEVAAATGPLMADGSGRIEIVMANGRRVLVDRDGDVEALIRVVQAGTITCSFRADSA